MLFYFFFCRRVLSMQIRCDVTDLKGVRPSVHVILFNICIFHIAGNIDYPAINFNFEIFLYKILNIVLYD